MFDFVWRASTGECGVRLDRATLRDGQSFKVEGRTFSLRMQPPALTVPAFFAVGLCPDPGFYKCREYAERYHCFESGTPRTHLSMTRPPSMPVDVHSVTLLTGVCLFGIHGAWGVADTGVRISLTDPGRPLQAPIHALGHSEALTFYEQESLCRLTRAVRVVVEMLRADLRPRLNVAVSVPCEEYVLYHLDAYHQGLLCGGLLLDWCELVTQRSRLLVDTFQSRWADLGVLQMGGLRPLRPVTPIIADCVSKGRVIEFTAVAAELRKDALWDSLLSMEGCASFRELARASYRYAMVQSAVLQGPSHLMIACDNVTELPLFHASRTAAHALRADAMMLGMHSLPNLDLGALGDTRLFYLPNRIDPAALNEILEFYNGC